MCILDKSYISNAIPDKNDMHICKQCNIPTTILHSDGIIVCNKCGLSNNILIFGLLNNEFSSFGNVISFGINSSKNTDIYKDSTNIYPTSTFHFKETYPFNDLKKGELVLINDVITNHVSGRWNQGDVYRLSKSEAIWTGRYFDIDVSSYAIGEFIG